MKWYITVGLTVLISVTTLLVRIPIPGGGYFNLGDVVIVFCGLFYGWKVGLVAGGIVSALADLIGFPVFAPITLIVKGLEGLICGLGKKDNVFQSYLFPLLAVIVMVGGYFGGSWIFPNLGPAVAFADLPLNIVQAAVGYAGGRVLFGAYKRIIEV